MVFDFNLSRHNLIFVRHNYHDETIDWYAIIFKFCKRNFAFVIVPSK